MSGKRLIHFNRDAVQGSALADASEHDQSNATAAVGHFSSVDEQSSQAPSAGKLANDAAQAPLYYTDHPKFNGSYVVDAARRCTGYSSIGCKVDSMKVRHYYRDHVPRELQEKMNAEVCFDFCANVTGASFFGLTNGRECYCTPYFELGGGGDGACDLPCPNGGLCGGHSYSNLYEMHDCNNMPAKYCNTPPPAVDHAKSMCRSADTVNSACAVECEHGYELAKNELQCVEYGNRLTYSWAQWDGTALCQPVKCGMPPMVDQARVANADMLFPNCVEYKCKLGFSVDQTAQGNKSFNACCQGDRTFSDTELCKPVECGVHDCAVNSEIYAGQAGRMLHFGDAAQCTCKRGYTLDMTPKGETHWDARCTASGEFTQDVPCLPVRCGPPPTYEFASRQPGADGETLADDASLFFPETLDYECKKGYTIDGRPKREVTGELFPTTDLFQIECEASGALNKKGACEPVKCGVPPPVEHASVNNDPTVYGNAVAYLCDEGFTTDGKPESQGGTRMFQVHCEFEGLFDPAPQKCLRVECGAAPQLDHAKAPGAETYVFEDIAGLECEPGYSTHPTDSPLSPKADKFGIQCMATGEWEQAPACVNIDDCLAETCMPVSTDGKPSGSGNINGVCVDEATASGKHIDDYHCACDPGYEEVTMNAGAKGDVRACVNINDCPTNSSSPNNFKCGHGMGGDKPGFGQCTDMLQAYMCVCDSGYYSGALEGKEGNSTCLPVNCGAVPEVGDAEGYISGQTPDHEGDVYYPQFVEYDLDVGYTLDGESAGLKHAKVRCMSNGVLEALPIPMPVTCGTPYSVSHSSYEPQAPAHLFGVTFTYTCDTGYSVDGTAAGSKESTVTCNADGTKSKQPSCPPVSCGTPGAVDHSTRPENEFTFGEVVTYRCDDGYSTDGTVAPTKKHFSKGCNAEGAFELPDSVPAGEDKCVPIECHGVPVHELATTETKTAVYPETVKYTANTGYTLDGNADGGKEFDCGCHTNGKYLPALPKLHPVKCGSPPKINFATRPDDHKTFLETVAVTCTLGHSLDGTSKGETVQEITCQADGTYTKEEACQKVECPEVPTVEHASRNGEGKVVFRDEVTYACGAGYTTDGTATGGTTVTTTCQADGAFSAHGECLNIDDCAGNKCGANGECEDLKEPTGVHLDDYECKCDSGFDQQVQDGFKICGNIPDCPLKACIPGSCEDLVNDYKCHCPEGYFEGPNEVEDLAHDCMPVSCQTPPNVLHAKTEPAAAQDQEVHFAEAAVQYRCDYGYTLDGSPSGQRSFEQSCTSSGSFAPETECLPVTCGDAPAMSNSTWPKGEVQFPDSVLYTCDEGFSTSVEGGHSKKFHAACDEEGDFQTEDQCYPMPCGPISKAGIEKATYMETAVLFFPEELSVVCRAGYTLDGEAAGKTDFEVTCRSTGEYCLGGDEHECAAACQPVRCHDKPSAAELRAESLCMDDVQLVQRPLAKAKSTKPKVARALKALKAGHKQRAVARVRKVTTKRKHRAAQEYTFLKRVATGSRAQTCDEPVFGEALPFVCQEGYTLTGMADGPVEFELGCQDSGNFDDSPNSGDASFPGCQPVKCFDAPSVPDAENNATEAGRFGQASGWVGYTCAEGFTTNGHADGATEFTAECSSWGEWLNFESCLPVNCGMVPTYDFASSDEMSLTYNQKATIVCFDGYSVDGSRAGESKFLTTCTAEGKYEAAHVCQDIDFCVDNQCGKNGDCEDDILSYMCHCHEGYEVSYTPDGQETCTEVNECVDWQGTVNCAVGGGECEDKLSGYACKCTEGYEVTTNEVGREQCSAKICGLVPVVSHSTNSMATPGAVTAATNERAKSAKQCWQITDPAECCGAIDARSGDDMYADQPCYPAKDGKKVNGHACEAENAILMIGGQGDMDRCGEAEPGVAPEPPPSDGKISFGMAPIGYTCADGYTTDGTVAGSNTFQITCASSGEFEGEEECKPVDCGGSPTEEHATVDGESTAKFQGSVMYECDEGYSLDSTAAGTWRFARTCQANGEYSDSGNDCHAVSCGNPPAMPFAKYAQVPHHFEGHDAEYTCEEGYTTDGEASGPTTLSISCQADGTYSGQGEDATVCEAVSCGVTESIENGVMPEKHLWYTMTARASCYAGYSVTGETSGATSFTVTCLADGTLNGTETCKPVSCGEPTGTIGSTPDETAAKVFGESVGFTCNEGYALFGLPTGGSTFSKSCLEDGSFSTNNPPDCADVDWCVGAPCGRNGNCTSRAAPAVGYDCSCFEGYEPKEVDGKTTCGEDDCAGHDCGVGGSCIDLSKQGGEEGQYTCECIAGYELATIEGEITCTRMQCGFMPEIQHSTSTFHTFDEAATEPQPADGPPVMYVHDEASYECGECYSMDQTANEAAKSWTVSCTTSAMLTQGFYCLPIKCDSMQVPLLENTEVVLKEGETVSMLSTHCGESVSLRCTEGYTLSGAAEGSKEFALSCHSDGTFSEPETCRPVSCGRAPQLAAASASTAGEVSFGYSISYVCDPGYVVADFTMYGEQQNMFSAHCGATGQLDWLVASGAWGGSVDPACVPITCGVPPEIPGAFLADANFMSRYSEAVTEELPIVPVPDAEDGQIEDPMAPSMINGLLQFSTSQQERMAEQVPVVRYPDTITYYCEPGKTRDGSASGSVIITVACSEDGMFLVDGFALDAVSCQTVSVKVEGYISDASDAAISVGTPSSPARVCIGDEASRVCVEGTYGQFSLNVPMSTAGAPWEFKVMHEDYISYESHLEVTGSINKGGAADVAMVKRMAEGEFRVTLEWALNSRDLDSHVYFGEGEYCHVYWARLGLDGNSCPKGQGARVYLERDDVSSYGPETIHFYKPDGGCDGASAGCLLKFRVLDYTRDHQSYFGGNVPYGYPPSDDSLSNLGKSQAVIKVYSGDGLRATYTIPEEVGDTGDMYTVFTYDASTDTLSEGDKHICPYLGTMGQKSMHSSMNSAGWSEISAWYDGLMTGIERTGQKYTGYDGLSDITYATYYTIKSTQTGWKDPQFECDDTEVSLNPAGGAATCTDGRFLRGFNREGSRYGANGLDQLVTMRCCKPAETTGYGACETINTGGFTADQPVQCPAMTLWVGLTSVGDLLEDINSITCCELPHDGCKRV